MKTILYVAYGSNLNKNQMRYRCPDAKPIGIGAISGYRLAFKRRYLTIEQDTASSVPVGVWRISELDEEILDRYEGYPSFYKKVWMMIPGYDEPALVYIMQNGFSPQAPTRVYWKTCIDGFADFGLDNKPLWQALEDVLEVAGNE